MTYRIKMDEQTLEFDARLEEDGESFVLSVDDRELSGKAVRVGSDRLMLDLEGRRVPVSLARGENGVWISCEGVVRFIEDAETRKRRGKVQADGPREVTPATPANVVRVLVEAGERVEKGQGLIVVSAMKMESTLTAPRDGIVSAIHCEPGALVKPGDILVEFEAETEN